MRISDWSSDVCSSDLAYAKPVKGSCVLERQFHALAQLVASFVDAADVVPEDIRHLHHDFAHGRWLDPFVGSDEIIPPHRSEEHTSELQSLIRISHAVSRLKINKTPSRRVLRLTVS